MLSCVLVKSTSFAYELLRSKCDDLVVVICSLETFRIMCGALEDSHEVKHHAVSSVKADPSTRASLQDFRIVFCMCVSW